jgi:lactoylglutathione lyase
MFVMVSSDGRRAAAVPPRRHHARRRRCRGSVVVLSRRVPGTPARQRAPFDSRGQDRLVRLRIELFVDDLNASIAFYTEVLQFRVVRRADDYVSVQRGTVVLGLGPVAKLPKRGDGPGFTRERLHRGKGGGVEIVLELDEAAELDTLYDRCRDRGVVVAALQDRPWGLRDFRLTDPDGYYLRVTHGNAAAGGG